MEVTPQLLKEVEFAERWRGYDPGEVDEFLERLGAGVAELRQRLQEAEARAEAAERRAAAAEARAAHGPGETADVETIQRTLLLAQRTADAAIHDAEQQAARTVAVAEERASAMLAEAEAEARRTVEGARQRLQSEVTSLEQAREALQGDVALLERHLEDARQRLRVSLRDLQEVLDHPELLRTPAPPQLSGVTVERAAEPPVGAGVDAAAAAAAQVLAGPPEEAPAGGPAREAGQADDLPDVATEPVAWYPLGGHADDVDDDGTPLAPPPPGDDGEVVDLADEPAGGRAGRGGLFVDDVPDAGWAERRDLGYGDGPDGGPGAGVPGDGPVEGQRRGLRRWR